MNEFRLGVFHPDENKNYLFLDYKEYKKWRDVDTYRYSDEYGGCCEYIYYNDYTEKRIEESMNRQERYWENKEIENLRSKIWRLNRKLEKLQNKGDGNND